jgi:hypothetical protein
MNTASRKESKAQSSFELLITLSFGIAILLPLVLIAFVQLSNASSSLTSAESQQAASKLSGVATFIGSEGPPAKQLVEIQVPQGVQYIDVGTQSNGVGHEVIFVIRSPTGLSYITSYTPTNVSGSLGGITSQGSYLINVSAQSNCPSNPLLPCVYMIPQT